MNENIERFPSPEEMKNTETIPEDIEGFEGESANSAGDGATTPEEIPGLEVEHTPDKALESGGDTTTESIPGLVTEEHEAVRRGTMSEGTSENTRGLDSSEAGTILRPGEDSGFYEIPGQERNAPPGASRDPSEHERARTIQGNAERGSEQTSLPIEARTWLKENFQMTEAELDEKIPEQTEKLLKLYRARMAVEEQHGKDGEVFDQDHVA